MNASEISRALRGQRSGDGYLVSCPVPDHGKGRGDRRPSLSIRDGDRGLLVHCHAGCDPRDVLDALRQRGLLDDRDPMRRHIEPRPKPEEPPATPSPLAIELWRLAEPIKGTLAHEYLLSRKLSISPPSLRYLPRDAHAFMSHVPFDAMIAAVQAGDRQIIAAQVTWLDPSGEGKADIDPPRRTIGSLRDGAVRLGCCSDTLGLAEGVETALGAMEYSGIPCWAALGRRMVNVTIPSPLKKLHLFADNGKAGEAAAEAAFDGHPEVARTMHLPNPMFSDFADVIAYAKGDAK